jgi:hypothetical protein
MSHRKRKSTLSAILPVLLTLLLTLVYACSDKTTEPKQETQGTLTGSGNIDPGATANFLLGSCTDSVVAPGRIEVWGSNVAFNADSGYVTFDVQLLNKSQRNIVPPVHFVITDIIPDDIALVGFDGVTADEFPFMDFSTKLGGDNVLAPGETSEPVMLKFHTVTARSFAIGFRIDLQGAAGPAMISGVVYRDANKDGLRDTCAACEPGIPGINVALQKPDGNGGTVTILTQTDANGGYGFGGLAAGVYKVFVIVALERWQVTTTSPLLITLVKDGNGVVQNFEGADFGLYNLLPPLPELIFGPVKVGPAGPYGTELDSTFVNPPSPLTVVFHYYLLATPPLNAWAVRGEVDSASAWINDVLVFTYSRPEPPDTMRTSCPPDSTWTWHFGEHKIALPDSLVKFGDNTIRIYTNGDEHAALMWRVFRMP